MLWRTDDKKNRNGRSIGHPFARTGLIGVMLLSISLCAGVAGCGSGSASPGPTPTPAPAPTPTPNPVPSVSGTSPSAAPAGALAFTLTVNGSSFINGSTVEWNGSSRTTTFLSSTQLQAHIMAADLASPGKVTVTVVNSAPGGGTSGGATFTVVVNTIAFESARALDGSDAAKTTSNIWTMNPDGSGATPLTKLTASLAGSISPVWKTDGSKIVFASGRALDGSDAANTNGTRNVWAMNADGSGATPLTKLTASGTSVDNALWSPDGSKILFESARVLDGSDALSPNFIFNIWLINADGSGATSLTKLTAPGTSNEEPVWSPDGSKIAFASFRALDGSDSSNGVRNIWVMNADGSGATSVTKLTAANSDSDQPSWTPDGSKVLFASERAVDGSNAGTPHGTFNIWIVNVDGSGATPLTKLVSSLGASSLLPKASADGSKIVCVSGRALDGSDAFNSTDNIWVVNSDGSSPTSLTKLTASGAGSFTPIWSPGGTQIFFSSQRALDGSDAANTNGVTNIWMVGTDGSGATPLTRITASGGGSLVPNQP
jgi:Tol biopolymer transport system component